MKLKFFLFSFIFSFSIYFPLQLNAGTELTIDTNPLLFLFGIDFDDKTDAEQTFSELPSDFFSKNDDVIPNGLVMTNTLGYPNGKSTIKPFPHFEFGAAAGGGVWQYTRFDDFDSDNPTVPFGGVNAAIHAGTGITENIDVTLKFFSLGWFYSVDDTFDYGDDRYDDKTDDDIDKPYIEAEITDSNVYSFGIKGRYNWLKPSSIIPYFLAFGGISINLGLDYMKGKWKVVYELHDTNDIDLKQDDETYTIEADTRLEGSASVEWSLLSITPEIFIYTDIFYVFSFYTGPSVSFNFGSINFNTDAEGNLDAKDADVGTVNLGDLHIGEVELRSRNKMEPSLVIPKWTLGLEMNIWALKIQVEGAAVLTSITESFTTQVGIRFQF